MLDTRIKQYRCDLKKESAKFSIKRPSTGRGQVLKPTQVAKLFAKYRMIICKIKKPDRHPTQNSLGLHHRRCRHPPNNYAQAAFDPRFSR